VTEIGFYHLQSSPLEEALPRLLEKALASGRRVAVKVLSEAEAERLAGVLWTYDPASFLPHGTARDGRAAEQPIYLGTGDEAPNGADLLCQVAGAESARIGDYARVVDMFDGADADAVAAARERWRRYQAEGHALAYYQQRPGGGWERKA
jgi:DNA polymerase-3 subunit chi